MTRIAAHRGGALERPENTLEAFAHAAGLGCEEVELDVHLSRDGVAMVHHDATLDRTTDGAGPLAALTRAELGRVRVKGSPREAVPTLDEALGVIAASALTARVEIKPGPGMRPYEGAEALVADALGRHGLGGRAVVTSFLAGVLRRPALADLPRILLVNPMAFACIDGLAGLEAVAERAGTRDAALPVMDLDEALMADATARGLVMSAFAAHDEAGIGRALDLRVPVFTTDRPTLALEVRSAARAGSRPAGSG